MAKAYANNRLWMTYTAIAWFLAAQFTCTKMYANESTIPEIVRQYISLLEHAQSKADLNRVRDRFEDEVLSLPAKRKELPAQLITALALTEGDEHYRAMLLVKFAQDEITNSDMMHGAIENLGSPHEKVRKFAATELSTLDGSSDEFRNPYFDFYEPYLRDRNDHSSEELIRYMYKHNPGLALLAMMRLHTEAQDARRPILWAEHVVSNTLWKQRHGFLGEHETEPEAINQIKKISEHQAWWARLYAAEIMRQHPEFRQQDVVERLAKDEHPLVREVIQAFSEKPNDANPR